MEDAQWWSSRRVSTLWEWAVSGMGIVIGPWEWRGKGHAGTETIPACLSRKFHTPAIFFLGDFILRLPRPNVIRENTAARFATWGMDERGTQWSLPSRVFWVDWELLVAEKARELGSHGKAISRLLFKLTESLKRGRERVEAWQYSHGESFL